MTLATCGERSYARRSIPSARSDRLARVRTINQDESIAMRDALKTIASYRNPAVAQDGAQVAAQLARETLDRLGLYTDEAEDRPILR